jgi:hypothetical protein
MAYTTRFGKLVRLHNQMSTVVRNTPAARPDAMPADTRKPQQSVAWRVGGRYNWKGQPERLVYLGRNWSGNGFWHQFEKVDAPGTVWCEVLDTDLSHFEETRPTAQGAAAQGGESC